MGYWSYFLKKMCFCFLPMEQYLRLTGEIWIHVCGWIRRTKCTKNWAGRAQILVSKNKKAARCPVFLKKKGGATKNLLVRVATPLKSSGQQWPPPRFSDPTSHIDVKVRPVHSVEVILNTTRTELSGNAQGPLNKKKTKDQRGSKGGEGSDRGSVAPNRRLE